MSNTSRRSHSKQTLFLLLAVCFLAACASSSRTPEVTRTPEVHGKYFGLAGGRPYTVTFGQGHTFQLSPPNSPLQTFDGTYTVEGNMLRGDLGSAKVNYEVVDEQTLRTVWQGFPVELKKK